MATHQTITVGFDLQGAYDQARLLSGCYGSFARSLAEHGGICTHLDTQTTAVDADSFLCHGCGRTVPVGLVEG